MVVVFESGTRPSRFAPFSQGAQPLAPAIQNCIRTSRIGPSPSVFYTFDLETCFAPQRRPLFRHLNFQEWSETVSVLHFWLGHLLRATTVCTFSAGQFLKVLRSWGVFSILTSKCASRDNGVQFFISHLASWLRTRRFGPTSRPSRATNQSRDFPAFCAPASSIFSFFLLSDLLSSLLFFDSSHLCFSIHPYCRKFGF